MSSNPQVRYTFLQHVQQGMPYLSRRAGGGSTYVLSPFSLYTKITKKKIYAEANSIPGDLGSLSHLMSRPRADLLGAQPWVNPFPGLDTNL